MSACPFCSIARGDADADLVVLRTASSFVVPALNQRPRNRGHVLVLPTAHVARLADADGALLADLYSAAGRVATAVRAAFGATGVSVFHHESAPDQVLDHLHVHVVPRHVDDDFRMPDPSGEVLDAAVRREQAAAVRAHLSVDTTPVVPTYTVGALLDVHERTHRSLAKLLAHCGGFSADELRRPLAGFGFPTLLEQLDHVLGAERYWIGVLDGEARFDEDEPVAASVAALDALRLSVAATTRTWIEACGDAALNAPVLRTTWGGKEASLVPAHVILRTQTHVFQHQGQVAAMARLLGRPIPAGLDFPLA